MLLLASDATYQALQLAEVHLGLSEPLDSPVQWLNAAGRSAVWYGFLFALIAAELFAGRALRRLVGDSLGRPSFGELEGMVRGPLGDPGLRLGFWRPRSLDWADADGEALALPRSDQSVTEFGRDGRPAVAIVHDQQLSEDPELLQAAGAVALLAMENAELDSAWKGSVGELADSRARLVRAGNRERRRLERDLHDGAQQRLMSLQIKLQMAQQHADPELAEELGDIRVDAIEAVEELRALAHGIYPPVLRERGVGSALRSVAMTAPIPITVNDQGIGRFEPAAEAAIYFCAMEGIQNTIKHAGDHPEVTIAFERDPDRVRFTVADNGVGMDTGSVAAGMGLTDMRDRIGAVGGQLELSSSPGQGTVIHGTVPDPNTRATSRPTAQPEGKPRRARTTGPRSL
jgi:signal transduction histidine kinase